MPLRECPRDAMRNVLVLAAVGEAATGLALLIAPSLVGRLLLGEKLTGVSILLAGVLLDGEAKGKHKATTMLPINLTRRSRNQA